jgi:hypothetical protein
LIALMLPLTTRLSDTRYPVGPLATLTTTAHSTQRQSRVSR